MSLQDFWHLTRNHEYDSIVIKKFDYTIQNRAFNSIIVIFAQQSHNMRIREKKVQHKISSKRINKNTCSMTPLLRSLFVMFFPKRIISFHFNFISFHCHASYYYIEKNFGNLWNLWKDKMGVETWMAFIASPHCIILYPKKWLSLQGPQCH